MMPPFPAIILPTILSIRPELPPFGSREAARREVIRLNTYHWVRKLRKACHRSDHTGLTRRRQRSHLADVRRYRRRIQSWGVDIMAAAEWPEKA
jgi:hypothetical protein